MRVTIGAITLWISLVVLGVLIGRISVPHSGSPLHVENASDEKPPIEERAPPEACPPIPATVSPDAPARRKDHVAVYLPIEPIGEQYAFRHPDKNAQDQRSYIKFFPTVVNVETLKPRRKIYFDLGLNTFDSSIQWVLEHYPAKFDEIYGWEAVPQLFQLPNNWKNLFPGKSEFFTKMIGLADTTDMTNLLRFMDDLSITEDDYVVMKMDVEGSEWELIPALFENGYFRVIDEFMCEIHYNEPELALAGWLKFPHRKEEVVYWLETLRGAGVYAHYWP